MSTVNESQNPTSAAPGPAAEQNQPRPNQAIRMMVSVIRFVVPVAIIAGAGWLAMMLLQTRPSSPRVEVVERATLVETIIPERKNDQAEIVAYGTVEPTRRLMLQPQVGGQVIELNDQMIKGGLVRAGEMLYRIDPRDYELNVQQRRADVARAQVAMQKENAFKVVAEREWELLGDSIEVTEEGRELARRGPQRLEAEAGLAAAEGRLSLAELDLERTTMKAPFNAMVLEDMIEIGQVIAPMSPTATLVGTDTFDVITSIPLEQLPWLRINPEDPTDNSTAEVILEFGEGQSIVHQARVVRIAGEVERAGRLARVIVQVPNPLGMADGNPATQLLLGSYVRVAIEGREVRDVMELPRSVVHENDTVWVLNQNGKLEIRTAEIIVGRTETVLVRMPFANGEEIISSPLVVAIPGMPLERIEPAGRPSEENSELAGQVDSGADS